MARQRLSERINWYGAYNFTAGQCLVRNNGNCNKEQTAEFLEHLKSWLDESSPAGKRRIVIWDGAPWHRAHVVRETAKACKLELIPLPGYSPDLNPIEGLWKWMRENVTQLHCHPSIQALSDACMKFISQINQDPAAVVNRLWPKFELDPEIEKLRFSC